MKRIILALALFASSSAFAAEAPIITGGLPRNLGSGSFTIVVKINGVTNEQKTKDDTEGSQDPVVRFGENLDVILPTVDGDPLPLSAEIASDPAKPKKFYVEQESVNQPEQNGELWNYTYNLRISALDSADLKKYVDQGNGVLKLSLKFYLGQVEIQKVEPPYELKQESYVMNALPTLSSIVGTNRALRIVWDVDTSVPIKGGTGEKAPTQVQVYLVDRSVTTDTSLPGRKFEPANAEGDPASTCTYKDAGTASGACVTCPADVYLDAEAIKSTAGFQVTAESNGDGFTQISGLDNEKQYMVFLQYQPDGLTPSIQCLAGQPSPDLSLTEANGEDEAEIVDFRCFIATAAYGSPLHDDLAVFRQFRDDVLMTSATGRAAVSVYYKWSPGVARYIAAHPRLKHFVRSGLQVVAEVLR